MHKVILGFIFLVKTVLAQGNGYDNPPLQFGNRNAPGRFGPYDRNANDFDNGANIDARLSQRIDGLNNINANRYGSSGVGLGPYDQSPNLPALNANSGGLSSLQLATGNVQGLHTHRGRCPITRNQQNIDVQRFMGIWYILERSNSLVPVDLCTTTNFTYIYDNVFQFIDGSKHYNDKHPSFKPQIGLCLFNPDYKQSATMNCIINTLPGNPQFDIRVLSTDYDTYCMMYVCRNNDDGTYTDLSSLFSRTPYLNESSRRYLRQITCNNVGHCVQMDILDHNPSCGTISDSDDRFDNINYNNNYGRRYWRSNQ